MATKLFEQDGFGFWQLQAGDGEVTIDRAASVKGTSGDDSLIVTNVGGLLPNISLLDGADTIEVRSYATGVEVAFVDLRDSTGGPDGDADTVRVNGDIFQNVGFGRGLNISGFGAQDRLIIDGVRGEEVEAVLNLPRSFDDGRGFSDFLDTTLDIGDGIVTIETEPFSSVADFLDRVTFSAGGTPTIPDGYQNTGENLSGGAGDDGLSGGDGPDTISGGGGNDQLTGGGGNDQVYGNQGDDQVYGNQGGDRLFGGQGDDLVFGGQGNDEVYGNLGNDQIYGNKGDDLLFGGQGDDLLFGGQGNDLLFGNKGDDSLWGNLGDDTMNGGAGVDDFVLNGGGSDRIQDFDAGAGDRFGHFGGFDDYTLSNTADGLRVSWEAGTETGDVVLEGLTSSDFSETWLL